MRGVMKSHDRITNEKLAPLSAILIIDLESPSGRLSQKAMAP